MEGNITIPYQWTTGEATGRFLTELRDKKKIIGSKCSSCGRILVPPQDFCAACFINTTDWVEVGDEGVMETFTVVHKKLIWRPFDPPYAIAAIRLEGASSNLLHIVRANDYGRLKAGLKVKAHWKEERTGSIFDIDCFRTVPEV